MKRRDSTEIGHVAKFTEGSNDQKCQIENVEDAHNEEDNANRLEREEIGPGGETGVCFTVNLVRSMVMLYIGSRNSWTMRTDDSTMEKIQRRLTRAILGM